MNYAFLQSLADSVKVEEMEEELQKFKNDFFNNKEELTNKLFKTFNDRIFGGKLQGLHIKWCNRLQKSAGICKCDKSRKEGTCEISLATKILNTAEKLRNTLIHEMCHAAVYMLSRVDEKSHGPIWKKWTRRAVRKCPELTKIEKHHNYETPPTNIIMYRCTACEIRIKRRRRIRKLEKICCSICRGKIVRVRSADDNKIN